MKRFFLTICLVLALVLPAAAAASAAEAEQVADCPALLTTAPTASGLTVRWSAYPDAAKYRLFYRGANGWIKVGDTAATSLTHSGLENGATYCYTVRALDDRGVYCSGYDREGITATFLSVPTLSAVTNEYTGQRVSWTAVPGAESYRVYLKATGAWIALGTTADCAFLYRDVQPGESYTYTVRCCTADGGRLLSYFDRGGISARFVAAPELTSCVAVSGGNQLTWTRSQGAELYRVFYKRADGSGWTRIGETSANSYTHTGLQNGATYTYTVRAFNRYGTAVSSFNSAGLTATYYSAPQLIGAENAYGGQRVRWNAVPGVSKYRVYVKQSSGWKMVAATVNTSYLYRAAVPGESYTYTVRCCSNDSTTLLSWYDSRGVSAVYYPAPEITGFAPADDGIHITWSAVDGADHYRLYVMTDGGWKTVSTIAATSLTHTGLSDGTAYTYTVRAMDRTGAFLSGFSADGWQYTYHTTPGITGIAYDGAYTVSWERPAGVIGWQLYRKTPDSGWKLLLNTRKRTSFIDTTAEPDVPYSYMLCYVNREEDPVNIVPAHMLYYLNGELIDGETEWNGNVLYFEEGRLRQGFVTVDGRTYYYNAGGVLMKNGIVGSSDEGYAFADENGVCCISEEMRLAARFMAECATGDTLDERMKTGYLYLAHQYPYHRTYDHPSKAEDMPALAIDMFTNEQGNCYRYAACFACLAKAAGYRARVVLGTTGGNPHGWVEVLVDGQWLICDPDAEIPKYGNPDYTAYMMTDHYWQITPKVRCEIVIDENGVASWI